MKVFVTTGCGNIIQGGADMWTNNFIELVLPYLDDYYILVDGRKPTDWEDTYDLEKSNLLHHHFNNSKKTEEILEKCDEIHFLHANYHKREHLWKWKDKWGTIFVQAYLPDMLDYKDSLRQFNTNVVEEDMNYLLTHCKKRIWIGNNPSRIFTKFVTETITNFYEFKHNKSLNPINDKIGFTSRIESRKNVQYLDGLKGYVLSGTYDWKNVVGTDKFDFSKFRFYPWSFDILNQFMELPWTISHSSHTNEPFGYSIFQSVDWGKLPILDEEWGDVEYRYRAGTKEEFKEIYKLLLSDNSDVHQEEFNRIKNYMKQFDNKKNWIEKIKKLF